jgi:hypothetical protein
MPEKEKKNEDPSLLKDNCIDKNKADSKTEVKNAHAVGLGSMGRSDEALPDKNEGETKVEPGAY